MIFQKLFLTVVRIFIMMRSRRGFTLIELLVVIAIIALLMAILMPALARVKKQAQSVVCQARLREWGFMFKFYTDDYDGYFNNRNVSGGLWMTALRSYYKDDAKMLLCPTATKLMQNASDWGTYKAASIDSYIFSYGINSWTNSVAQDRDTFRLEEWFWKNVWDVGEKNNIPVFADGTWHDAWPRYTDMPVQFPEGFGIGNRGTSGDINHFCIDRHNGAVNMLFMDWSARKIGLKELWKFKWHREFDTAGPWTKAGGVQPLDWPQWMRNFKDY